MNWAFLGHWRRATVCNTRDLRCPIRLLPRHLQEHNKPWLCVKDWCYQGHCSFFLHYFLWNRSQKTEDRKRYAFKLFQASEKALTATAQESGVYDTYFASLWFALDANKPKSQTPNFDCIKLNMSSESIRFMSALCFLDKVHAATLSFSGNVENKYQSAPRYEPFPNFLSESICSTLRPPCFERYFIATLLSRTEHQ